jgi:hypothetical protein
LRYAYTAAAVAPLVIRAGTDRYLDREITAIEQATADQPNSREELAPRLAQSERRVTPGRPNSYARA